ncbi:aromatase/cyclase [Saccharopolyspora gloriosae]|uniref:aromatase/cyclase n=1 Tax=Saccharopolyspora gloriosae TaxID=455344 RepID=UPI001FB5CB33|nr:aromatase/cyclase [Saccharopolyspora gloriosae]
MSRTEPHRTEHRLVVAAPADRLYALVAGVQRWPAVFAPNLHVHHLHRTPHQERFRIWALLNGTVRNWTSRRELDPRGLRVTFEQEVSSPPIASMGGEWSMRQLSGSRTELLLLHHFTAVDDDPSTIDWINRAVDANSKRELEALRDVAERGADLNDVVFSFEDSLRCAGRAADCYEFVHRADLWDHRLPHVSRVRLDEDDEGVQQLEMDTTTEDGGTHTTRSYRVCSAPSWIGYKQTVLPALLTGHSGLWTFSEDAGTTTMTARHTVAIKTDVISDVLGPGRSVADARTFLRSALGANSLTTLTRAAEFAESRSGKQASR